MEKTKSEQKHEQTIEFETEDFLEKLGVEYSGQLRSVSLASWNNTENIELSVISLEIDRLKQIDYNKKVIDQ